MSNLLLLILSSVVFFWLTAITFLLIRVLKTFVRLTKGLSEKDLISLLNDVLNEVEKEKKFTEELEDRINELKTDGLSNIKKIGLVRYNPFSETGGNQSFVLALLDSNDNGFVVTSLHSRESTRVFAKPVFGGKESGFEFSKEEILAILEAKKSKNIKK